MTTHRIEISSKTVIFTVFFLIGLGFLWQIRDLIFSLIIAFIIAGSLKPAVDQLAKLKVNRGIAAVLVYFSFIFIFFYIITLIIPPLAEEMTSLFKSLPLIIEKTLPKFGEVLDLDFVFRNLPGLTNQTIDLIKNIFGNAVFISSTLFFGFYFLSENDLIQKLFKNFFEEKELDRISLIVERSQKRMSSWFWGEIILMLAVGFLTYVGLTIFNIRYALALAVLAGLLEVVPGIGPVFSAVPAVLIGFSHSLVSGLSMAGLYLTVQQLENNLIVPLIMKKATGLHPIVILIALTVGGKLAGILGVLLAVPITILIETTIIELHKMR